MEISASGRWDDHHRPASSSSAPPRIDGAAKDERKEQCGSSRRIPALESGTPVASVDA
jgi:hypothetical protein